MVQRTTRKKANKRASNSPLPGWVWLLTGLIIGLSATFLPSINDRSNTESGTANVAEETTAELAVKRTFDFYTLLPELEVIVDQDSSQSSTTKSKLPAGEYVLQVGSFKSQKEANNLKAQLALMGVETNIETVKINTTSWHRVRVGPNKNIFQLQSIQQRLQTKKMDSILLKIRS